MPDDFRIPVGYLDHPKTQKLIRRCGPAGCISHLTLIEFCTKTESRTQGNLGGMDDDDIEVAANWRGDRGVLIAALAPTDDGGVGYLDGGAGYYQMHQWAVHQPWVAGAKGRSEAARAAALTKHHQAGRHLTPHDACPSCNPQAVGLRNPAPRSPTAAEPPKKVSPISISIPISKPISNSAAAPPQNDGLSIGDIHDLVCERWRWSVQIGSKWTPLMQQLSPFTSDEVEAAKLETVAKSGKPNIGYLLRVIERLRNEEPAKPNYPTDPTSNWARGRAREKAERAGKPMPEDDRQPTDEEFATGKTAVADIIANLAGGKAMTNDG